MKRIKSPPAQGRLFGSRGTVERFRIEEATGRVFRTVMRSDPDAPSVVTEIGTCPPGANRDDVRAAADLAYLCRQSAPSETASPEKVVRVVDLFSGCGAMSLGISEACRALNLRAEHVAGFELHPKIAEVYGRNFGIVDMRPQDLNEILEPELETALNEDEDALVSSLGKVDFVCAGPPCKGHSNLNNRTRRADPRNALYFLVARFAKLVKPRWIVIENVIAVLHDKGQVVQRTKEALESLGYETSDGIIDLWTLGVAQTRRRHIMVAQLRSADAGDKRELPFLEDLVAPYVTRHRAISWAVEDLLDVPQDRFIDIPRQPDPVTQSRIDYLFDHDIHDLPKTMRPESHKGEHGDNYKAVYGRMYWDEPAPTMTGGFLTMGQGRFVHPKRRRTITPHEAARIQFIPDFFDFSPLTENRGVLAETIGNAVPPKLSYVIGLELMR